MKTLYTCLAFAVAGLCSTHAQEGFDPLGEEAEQYLPKAVRVQVEFIEIPHETMTELLAGPQTSADATKFRTEIKELIKSGKAKILETQLATARSGQKATSESVHEYIYPTEYEPAVSPNEEEGEDGSTILPVNPPTPTAFETRDVGSILEIEPTVGEDDKFIDLRFLPELTYHTGNEVWAEVTTGEDTNKIQMPNFYTISMNTSVTLITGQYYLAAALSPKNDDGEADFSRKILIFVKADVLTVGR